MSTRNWREIAELIGIAAIVASLIFVGLQLQQDTQIARSESLVADQVLDLEFAQLIDGRRNVWRRGLAGEQLSDDDQVSFDLMAYALFRQQANDFRRGLVFGDAITDLTADSYAFFVYGNPGLRVWFDELVEVRSYVAVALQTPDEIRFFPKIVNDILKQLDEAGPELPDRYYYPY